MQTSMPTGGPGSRGRISPRFLLLFTALSAALLPAAFAQDSNNVPAVPIRLNTVGFLPHAPKLASIAQPCTNFTVVRVADGTRAFAGTVSGPAVNSDTRESLYLADFSALTNAGQYRLEIPGVGSSATFAVGPDVYAAPFQAAMLGMYLWRCGEPVRAEYHGQIFAHAACHTNDAWLDAVGGGHTNLDGTGGWHDAGDYNKYVVNAGVTLGAMVKAWEDFQPQIKKLHVPVPESGGPLPDFLAEVKYETDWLLKMQAPDGSVYHKITTKRFGPFILPELEAEPRYFTPWGTEATADFVAMLAQASRAFRPYDAAYADRCLHAASNSYAFLQAHPNYHRADMTGFRTGSYEGPSTNATPHNRLWAVAELWQSTGSPEYLADLEKQIRGVDAKVDIDFDWAEAKNLGLLTYLFSERPGRDPALVAQVRKNVIAAADHMVAERDRHGYGRPLGTVYFWGCNGGVARQSLLLMAADRLTSKGASGLSPYRTACLDALAHLLGRNYFGRSYITGVGNFPPMHPHDRRSGGDAVEEPWPGYLVGGPNPGATDWQDNQGNARVNEIAINWNGALIYLLAANLAE
ncbi:MAG: glycoside hydrolase family 9 protein [Verrucomicrobiota bacterium]